jgi:hypothetical protein
MVKGWYLGAADAGGVALQPGEVAAGVDVEEIGLGRVANAHGHVVQPAQGNDYLRKIRIKDFHHSTLSWLLQ